MNIIAHRINTIKELEKIPVEFGVEIDLRDRGGDLMLQHDPFKGGEYFEDYLSRYQHGQIILNIKSERIEYKVLEILQKYNVKKYFFLDSSFPMIYQLANAGERNIAVRFSEIEGLDTVLAVKGMVEWVWADCFSKLPLNRENFKLMKEAGFKICIVSPELQGRDADIEKYKAYLEENQIVFDAVCTKAANAARWLK